MTKNIYKLLLLIILIMVFGLYFLRMRQSPALTQVYQDENNYITLSFPEEWSFELKENRSQFEQDVNNDLALKNLELSGPEGNIFITWADTYGGGCEHGYTKLNLKNVEVDVCHFFDSEQENQENWTGIQERLNKDSGLGVYITASVNNDGPKNSREVVLGVLSSIELYYK
jgi:hypothetical protein